MSIWCQWEELDKSWVCGQCKAVVPKSVVPEKPFSACMVGIKRENTTLEDVLKMRFQPEPQEVQDGPGTELKKLLSKVGITASANCSCNARAAQMNAWGADESEKRIDEIVGWLREEATKRKLPFIDAAGRLLVRRAIANAKRKSTLTS
jgi:hypothetical protein